MLKTRRMMQKGRNKSSSSLQMVRPFSLISSPSTSRLPKLIYILGGTNISFNLPDGPPPADLRLSEEAADMDIEEVRKALQLRWDLFSAFPAKMQEALKSEKLEKVNKVLGEMEVSEAEDVVEKLQMGGMLMFSESGIRDVTGGDQ